MGEQPGTGSGCGRRGRSGARVAGEAFHHSVIVSWHIQDFRLEVGTEFLQLLLTAFCYLHSCTPVGIKTGSWSWRHGIEDMQIALPSSDPAAPLGLPNLRKGVHSLPAAVVPLPVDAAAIKQVDDDGGDCHTHFPSDDNDDEGYSDGGGGHIPFPSDDDAEPHPRRPAAAPALHAATAPRLLLRRRGAAVAVAAASPAARRTSSPRRPPPRRRLPCPERRVREEEEGRDEGKKRPS
ncbi:bzip-related transcription factor-like protein [Oryza sativa Japonica Group]|uniref:Bzip-related transcription factor-like protein n=1 Tax=Oryza sativa subsp. japonica TaxID=39947 RepID=Q5VQJ3_ORYSJ|nr:bzip-related transcription factor-like protein [Oryza sativa Japonica Group]